MKKYESIDYCRGIGIVFVVAAHAFTQQLRSEFIMIASLHQLLGIVLSIIISGVIIKICCRLVGTLGRAARRRTVA